MILAAEDIGLANPNALLLANACFDTVHKIGMPEARITLAETTIYLATSAKSNSAYMAINKALALVERHDEPSRAAAPAQRPDQTHETGRLLRRLQVRPRLRGTLCRTGVPARIARGTKFYEPDTQNAAEAKIAERIARLWKDKYK